MGKVGELMTLDEQWAELKPIVLGLLNDGWSKNYAFKKAGIQPFGKIYRLCYMLDKEFRNKIQDYNKKQRGFS